MDIETILWIHAKFALVLVLTLAASSCGSKSPKGTEQDFVIAVAILAEQTPSHDAVVWTMDDKGNLISHWLRGNVLALDFIASRPGLVIPMGDAVWLWRETQSPIGLCDCEAWKIINYEGVCPIDENSASVTNIHLVDRVSGKETELIKASEINIEDDFPIGEFRAKATPIATVGPYLFVRYHEESVTCRTSHNLIRNGFMVFDLEKQTEVDIIDVSEREKIEKEEKTSAFRLMQGDRLAHVASATDLELTSIEPHYLAVQGLTVSYQFTAHAMFDHSNADQQSSYLTTVSIPAKTMPRALVPFVSLPSMVRAFALGIPKNEIGGWTAVVGSPEKVSQLMAAFIKE